MKQASFRFVVRSEFESFGKPKAIQKLAVEAFFSMLFCNAFLHGISIDFWFYGTTREEAPKVRAKKLEFSAVRSGQRAWTDAAARFWQWLDEL